jgi:hypothetical protein
VLEAVSGGERLLRVALDRHLLVVRSRLAARGRLD